MNRNSRILYKHFKISNFLLGFLVLSTTLFFGYGVLANEEGVFLPPPLPLSHELSEMQNEKIQGHFFKVWSEIEKGHIHRVYVQALHSWVNSSVQVLRENNQEGLARQIELEWEFNIRQFHLKIDGEINGEINGYIDSFNLGDHRAISAWLGRTYDKIEKILGEKICKMTNLYDIKAINFGYIVTIYPNGDPKTGEKWDKNEYRLHFVPFTTAVTYWAAKLACDLSLAGVASTICSMGLTIPRYLIERYAAPKLSDYIYDKSHS